MSFGPLGRLKCLSELVRPRHVHFYLRCPAARLMQSSPRKLKARWLALRDDVSILCEIAHFLKADRTYIRTARRKFSCGYMHVRSQPSLKVRWHADCSLIG